MKKTLLRLAGLAALSWSSLGLALDLPPDSRVPGGVAVIPVGDEGQPAPTVYFNDARVLVVNDDGWKAIVGIPLATQPGTQLLKIGDYTTAFEVAPKAYAEQRLTVSRKYVAPDPEQLKRIRREQKRIRAALDQFSDETPATLRFLQPVEGRESSPFGLRRFFNDEPRKPHSGLDLAAPTGTTIASPAPGRIIDSGNFYFNGNTVFVDHGGGLVTMYCHMDKITVKPGQQVQTGEALGTVGATGRVTGPHLHWGVTLNGTMVDPSLFMAPKAD